MILRDRPPAGPYARFVAGAFCLLFTSISASVSHAAGIKVRFLAAVAADSAESAESGHSVARYDIWRSDGGAPAALVGSLPAPAAGDTLAFPDSSAARGTAYAYSIRAVDAAGNESDPSETTWVALPRLALPDTARQAGGSLRITLTSESLPLRGHAQPSFAVEPAGSLRLAFDSASGILEFLPAADRVGRADTVRAVVRMDYFGKFADADTVIVFFAGQAPTSLRPATKAPAATRSMGALGRIAVAAPGGRTLLFDPSGRLLKVFRGSQPSTP